MGYTELARWLNSQGVLTGGGRPSWSLRGVKDIIRNRVYLGVAYAGDVENPDAHPALIDAETWRAAQHTGQRIPRRAEHVSPLGGLMRCAACRYLMRVERRARPGGDVWCFSCRSTKGAQEWICDAPARIVLSVQQHDQIVTTFLSRLPDFVARAAHDAAPR